jgi:alpha-L-rhamnosidase
MYVVDFGQNLSGWLRIRLRGMVRGQRVQLRHAELKMHPPYGAVDGTLYYDNLRGAQATDVYYARGDGQEESFEPAFTYHGFRFAEITGLTFPLAQEDIVAVHVRSDVDQTGAAAFSHPLLNQIQHNVLWGQTTNLMGVPTDCDQRDERRGWTGDAALSSAEALLNYDMGAFYHNFLRLIVDAMGANHTIPNYVPTDGNPASGQPTDPAWGR